MRSVTEQGALDEFLATAELADTDFTAEKTNNVKIIHTDQKNPYLLSAAEERNILGKHKAHRGRLTVPRRPKWDASTTPEELDARERHGFLDWRRGLAELQENNDLLMTPFERNLEVWRQLWRVVERSDLVVQIVDARSPLLFRSADLENYVTDVDPRKNNLLLVNKADMLTANQRRAWAKYLKEAGIAYKFFSAFLAKESNEAKTSDDEDDEEDERIVIEGEEEEKEEEDESEEESDEDDARQGAGGSEEDVTEEDIKILTVQELESLFLEHSPETDGKIGDPYPKIISGTNTVLCRPQEEAPDWPRWLPQRRKVVHHQLPHRSHQSLSFSNTGKDEALPNNPPQRQGHSLRLPRPSVSQLRNDQGRPRVQRRPPHRPDEGVHRPCRACCAEDTEALPGGALRHPDQDEAARGGRDRDSDSGGDARGLRKGQGLPDAGTGPAGRGAGGSVRAEGLRQRQATLLPPAAGRL